MVRTRRTPRAIPSDFIGLARDEQTKRLLAATVRLVDAHDDLLLGERVQRIKQRIIKNYLTVLPGTTLQEAQAGRLLGQELRRAFGDASHLVGQMRVRVVFKAVTYARRWWTPSFRKS